MSADEKQKRFRSSDPDMNFTDKFIT